MSRIALSKAVLEWALRRRGLTIAKLRPKFPKIQEWVEGSSNPTLKQVETLAALPHFVGHVDFASNQFLIANTPSHPHSAITLSR
jgi:hypothetical protein